MLGAGEGESEPGDWRPRALDWLLKQGLMRCSLNDTCFCPVPSVMCCELAAASWSRLALLLGVAAITLQSLSLFTGHWISTREVLEPPEASVRYGSVVVHTRVGMLRTCVRVEKINATFYPCESRPALGCSLREQDSTKTT